MITNAQNTFAGLLVLLFSVVVLCVPSTADAAILRKPPNNLGLKGYWSFNEGTSTIATDFSRNYATGTLTNMESTDWVAGKLGKALEFDGGGTEYVDLGLVIPGISGNAAFTMCAWVNTDSVSSVQTIVATGNPAVSLNAAALFLNANSNGSLSMEFGGSKTAGSATGLIAVGRWYHVCGTKTAGAINTTSALYINGINTSISTASTDIPSIATTDASIGRFVNTGGYDFDGKIDEVRVYNRALSASEILTLYRSGSVVTNTSRNTRLTSGLVGLWSFDGADVVNGAMRDRSVSNRTAYMVNTMATSTAYAPGRIGQGMKLNGTSDFLHVPSSAPTYDFGSGSFTIAWWEYRTSNDNGRAAIARAANAPYVPFLLGYSAAGADLYIYMSSNGSSWDIADGKTLGEVTLNTWNHFIVQRSGNTFTAYKNGVQTDTWSSALALGTVAGGSNNDEQVNFGRYDSSFFFQGTLDDIRFYNRAITVAEIAQLYATGQTTKVNVSQNKKNTSGLVGLWSFDGPDMIAGGTAYDRSGSAFDGVLNNMSATAAVPGKVGQALYFDGSDDYVDASAIAASGFFGGAHTLSVWGKLDQWNANRTIIGGGITSSNSGYSEIDYNFSDSTIYCRAWDIGTGVSNDVPSLATHSGDAAWHHFVMTVNAAGNITGCYIDGVNQGTAANDNDLSFIDTFYVGQLPYPGSNINPWSGKIDSARVYNRALSATEVLTLYNTEK